MKKKCILGVILVSSILVAAAISLCLFDRSDSDVDGLSDFEELFVLRTSPYEIDTDKGGLDDFNEVFTYGTDPNNPYDDNELIKRIPDVEARRWLGHEGIGFKKWSLYDSETSFENYISISMRDPLLQWYAERAEIRWETDSEGRKTGKLYVNEEPVKIGPPRSAEGVAQPSYYFTHGRLGACFESALANNVILKLMGYKCRFVSGIFMEVMPHAWNEVCVDGKVYVVNFNDLFSRDNFYEENGWQIFSADYDPDWYRD